MNILIVDDDIVDREHIKRSLYASLKASEYFIAEAGSVDEGLLQFTDHSFDVVLLDYKMPQRDGIEMLIELNNEPKEAGTAIVMMSNSEEEQLALDCLRAGAQDFIVKNDITDSRLRRAILNAQTRHELEVKLYKSYEKIKEMAEQDSLTGLSNRYVFDEGLRITIANNRRSKEKIALLLVDLDNFKYINDNYGHDVGDLLLKNIVNRIQENLRGNELFARLGGDEFGILLNDIHNIRGASVVAQRIRDILQKPFEIGSAQVSTSVSIGISIFPDNGNSAEQTFKFADIAMYRAKKLGKNQICFFEEEMQKEFSMRYQIENNLRHAIEENQFSLHYQPVVGLKKNDLVGFEALIRWTSDGKLIGPDIFIPIAEDAHLINDIGKWVIENAVSQIAVWNNGSSYPLTMSINLSIIQLTDVHLPEFIQECMTKNKVNPELIEFELTETALSDHNKDELNIINSISQLGCRIALDDFGTGYSSISHLMDFPVSTVKIDKSLMPDKTKNKKKTSLLRGLVSMLKHLELDIIAEGVETENHLGFCRDLDVNKIQGYFMAEPFSSDVIEAKYLKEGGYVFVH